MTRNFHANITVWKNFSKGPVDKKKVFSIFLLPDGNAYWWILIIVVHLWRNFPLSPVLLKKNFVLFPHWLVSYVSSFVFLLYDYYSLFCLLLVPFLPSSFSILLLISRFVFFSTVTGSFLLQMKTKFKYLMRCWKGNGRKGVDFKFLLQHALFVTGNQWRILFLLLSVDQFFFSSCHKNSSQKRVARKMRVKESHFSLSIMHYSCQRDEFQESWDWNNIK